MLKSEPEHLCSTCAHATPVTDKWLAARTHRPTLARCEFRRYLVLWDGKCEEKDLFKGKDKWKRKK